MSDILKNTKLLSWFNFCSDFKLYAPIQILFYAEVTGSYALGMAVFSVTMISAAVFELPTGLLSDYVGRRKTIAIGSFCSFLGVLCYALSGGFYLLAIGGLFEGISRSLFSGNNDALLFESLKNNDKEEEYLTHKGHTDSAFQVALAFAAVLGSVIAEYSFRWVIYLTLIPQFICIVISFLFIEPESLEDIAGESPVKKVINGLKEFKSNFRLRLIALAEIITFTLGETTHLFSIAFIALVWPVWAIGINRMLGNIFAIIGMKYADFFIKKFGHSKALVWGAFYGRVVYFLAVAFPTVASPVLMSSVSLPWGTQVIARSELMQRDFDDSKRATMGSLVSLMGSLAFGVVSVIFGYYADCVGEVVALVTGQILYFPVVYIYWRAFKK